MHKNSTIAPAHKGPHSSLLSELERGFARRLRQAIGDRSIHSFAKSCGMSDSLVRKYLAGSVPGLDKALIMAVEAGVSLEWLATGNDTSEAGWQAGLSRQLVDIEWVEEVIATTRRQFLDRGISLPPEEEAKVIRLICEFNSSGKAGREGKVNNIDINGRDFPI